MKERGSKKQTGRQKNKRMRKMRGWQGNKRCKRKKNKWGMCQKKKVPGKRTSRKGFGMI